MSKQLDELLDKYAWNSLQIQQLRIADKKHLDLSYFSTKYDWEQMREIRLCLEDGMDPSFICDPHISAKSMQKSREAISHMSGTFDEKIERIKQQKQIRIILLVVCILIMLAGFIIAMWQKNYLLSMINPLELELVSESEIRGVSEVPEIHYIDFVKDYTDGSELILPDTVITGVGDYTLTYTVKSPTKETQRTMVLIIVDDISPVITLTSNSITLEYGTTFDARSYLSSVTDNVDGDLMDSVEISSDVDTGTAGHYSVTYSVADSTGNTGQAVLNVTISPEPEPIVSPPSGGSSSSSSSGNMSGSNQSHASDPTAVSRTFYFSDYGSAEATLNAAQNYGRSALSAGQASHYTCNPIMQDGIYVGYQVIFS